MVKNLTLIPFVLGLANCVSDGSSHVQNSPTAINVASSAVTNTQGPDDSKSIAVARVEKFHRLFNEKKFDELYEMCGEKIKTRQGKEKFIELLRTFHSVTGKAKSYQENRAPKITTDSGQTSVSLLLDTDFEQGTFQEGFVFLIIGQEAKLDYFDMGFS